MLIFFFLYIFRHAHIGCIVFESNLTVFVHSDATLIVVVVVMVFFIVLCFCSIDVYPLQLYDRMFMFLWLSKNRTVFRDMYTNTKRREGWKREHKQHNEWEERTAVDFCRNHRELIWFLACYSYVSLNWLLIDRYSFSSRTDLVQCRRTEIFDYRIPSIVIFPEGICQRKKKEVEKRFTIEWINGLYCSSCHNAIEVDVHHRRIWSVLSIGSNIRRRTSFDWVPVFWTKLQSTRTTNSVFKWNSRRFIWTSISAIDSCKANFDCQLIIGFS